MKKVNVTLTHGKVDINSPEQRLFFILDIPTMHNIRNETKLLKIQKEGKKG
jgi:hypothetical protein